MLAMSRRHHPCLALKDTDKMILRAFAFKDREDRRNYLRAILLATNSLSPDEAVHFVTEASSEESEDIGDSDEEHVFEATDFDFTKWSTSEVTTS